MFDMKQGAKLKVCLGSIFIWQQISFYEEQDFILLRSVEIEVALQWLALKLRIFKFS